MADRLDGVRVLLVEDESLVAAVLEDLLISAGCTVVGPIANLDNAMRAARSEVFDIALIDVNLGKTSSYPVGEALALRNLPFIFLTGYGKSAMPAEHADWPCIAKPYKPAELLGTLSRALERAPRPATLNEANEATP